MSSDIGFSMFEYIKTNKLIFIFSFIISLFISVLYEYSIVQKNKLNPKYIGYTKIFIGNIKYFSKNSEELVNSLAVNRFKVKELIRERINQNFSLSFNLLDINNSTLVIQYLDKDKENVRKTNEQFFNIIYNHAVEELEIKKQQSIRIKHIQLPFIVDSEVIDLEYKFNIYFVSSFISLVFISVFILQLYIDKWRDKRV